MSFVNHFLKPELRERILRLNPLTALYFCLCEIAVVAIFYNIFVSVTGFLTLTVVAIGMGKGKKFFSSLFKSLSVLILLIFLLQSLLFTGHSDILWKWNFISIKTAGVLYSVCLSLIILNISGSVFLLFFLTNPKKLVNALECRRLPPKAAYVILSTFQIVPQMSLQSKLIMDAQRSRAMETEGSLFIRAKAFFPTLVPLVLNSIVSIEERALMLEARAFTFPAPKTHLHTPKDLRIDRILRSVFILIAITALVGRILLWIV